MGQKASLSLHPLGRFAVLPPKTSSSKTNMFGFFKKRKPANALDNVIFALYGNPPPPKRANVDEAVKLASEDLLSGIMDQAEVRKLTVALAAGPIPYSTHDLAVSVALNFYKNPSFVARLRSAQLLARLNALQWIEQGLALPILVKSLEDLLYIQYKPGS